MIKVLGNNIEKALIIITGVSASGKTTLAYKLKEKIGDIDILSVDDYKQKIYESIGFMNNYERIILNNMAKLKFKADILVLMRNNKNIIVEYPFNTSWQEFFDTSSKQYNYTTIVINCNTRDFEDIWQSRIKRDTNFLIRPKCLTAQAYTKDGLYVAAEKMNEEYKNSIRELYINESYTSIKGDYIFKDTEVLIHNTISKY